MADPKPLYATDYSPEQLGRSLRALLHVAVALGDDLPHVVLVGGLVPLFLVDQAEATTRDEAHIGSADVDVALHFALVDEARYDALAGRLAAAGFTPDRNPRGNLTPQRWTYRPDPSVKIDFLIDETETDDGTWDRVLHLGDDLAAVRALGLALAFEDSVDHELDGDTLDGAHARRTLRVCGPAAFVVLKALAFRNRAARKDAYDLAYVLRNVAGGPEGVVGRLVPFREHPAVQRAAEILRDDFGSERETGPRAASAFLFDERIDADYVADVVGLVQLLLQRLEAAA